MSNLAMYIPPLASDFSGVCSVLFDLGGLVVMHDASCCTKNYVEYEEPRWQREKNTTFCSQLRSIDAILGNDDKLIEQITEAAQGLKPPFVAVLGSPVPAIIGTDMTGIAKEIEGRCGIPTLGFDTNGFSFYGQGVATALLKLVEKFAENKQVAVENTINILGLTPLDFSANENSLDFCQFFQAKGMRVNCSMAMNFSMESLKNIGQAQANLVVAAAGLPCAKYLEEHFGIPYVVATPLGQDFANLVATQLALATKTKKSKNLEIPLPVYENGGQVAKAKILILGEQVIANSLRNLLYQKGCKQQIVVGCFLKLQQELENQADLFFRSEKQLIETLRQEQFDKIIADPLLFTIPATQSATCFALPHWAVSSNIYADKIPRFLSKEFELEVDSWLP